MKHVFKAGVLLLVSATPSHAGSWSPPSLRDAAPVALVALGFLAIAGALRGRKL